MLLKIYNGTETKDGVSVKLSTEDYADTDFVLNTEDTTFRLPIKVKLASGNAVVGNGMGLGFDTGVTGYEHLGIRAGDGGQSSVFIGSIDGYGKNVGDTAGTGIATGKVAGITTDPTKSGIETSSQGLKLYFYVGETVQDANVIAASGVLTKVSNCIDRTVASDREIVVGWGMPDYSAGIGLGGLTSFTAPADGVAYVLNNYQQTMDVYINGVYLGYHLSNSQVTGTYILNKGDVLTTSSAINNTAYFFPLKGAN
ncbi:MAG: hypothetical protein ACI4V7_01005 [Succinivibrionaceae bacterium]